MKRNNRGVPNRRRGVAAVWALAVLAVVSGLGLCLVAGVSLSRKEMDREQAKDQAEWLVRSGIELAIDRLQAKKPAYTGETLSPISGGETKITVRPRTKTADVYEIECEVRYRVDPNAPVIVQTGRRVVKVDASGKIEVVTDR